MSVSKKARNIPAKYLGAFKKGHRFSSRDMIDEELAWTLLDRIEKSKGADVEAVQAMEYLVKFNNEYHKNVIKKNDSTALHNTDELRRDLYSRENAKNRDIMSVQNQTVTRTTYKSKEDSSADVDISSGIDNWDQNKVSAHTPYSNNVEDAIIDLLDGKDLYNSPNDPEQ